MTMYIRQDGHNGQLEYTVGSASLLALIANDTRTAILLSQHRDQIALVGVEKIRALSGILLEILKEHDTLNNQEVNHAEYV